MLSLMMIPSRVLLHRLPPLPLRLPPPAHLSRDPYLRGIFDRGDDESPMSPGYPNFDKRRWRISYATPLSSSPTHSGLGLWGQDRTFQPQHHHLPRLTHHQWMAPSTIGHGQWTKRSPHALRDYLCNTTHVIVPYIFTVNQKLLRYTTSFSQFCFLCFFFTCPYKVFSCSPSSCRALRLFWGIMWSLACGHAYQNRYPWITWHMDYRGSPIGKETHWFKVGL